MFRRDQKNEDSFQRQITALRQQLGASASDLDQDEITIDTEPTSIWNAPSTSEARSSRSFGAYEPAGYGFPETPAATGYDLAVVAPSLPALPAVDANATVVAHQAKWVGELSTSDPIHVHGRFEGAINSESEVFIGEEADVQATVTANSVIVAGLIKGALRCASRLEILPSGRVMADIHAPSLVVHSGAILTGSVKMNATENEKNPAARSMRKSTRVG